MQFITALRNITFSYQEKRLSNLLFSSKLIHSSKIDKIHEILELWYMNVCVLVRPRMYAGKSGIQFSDDEKNILYHKHQHCAYIFINLDTHVQAKMISKTLNL